eukprot:365741-Chlamydomonas_euryale.AAC.4
MKAGRVRVEKLLCGAKGRVWGNRKSRRRKFYASGTHLDTRGAASRHERQQRHAAAAARPVELCSAHEERGQETAALCDRARHKHAVVVDLRSGRAGRQRGGEGGAVTLCSQEVKETHTPARSGTGSGAATV